MINGSFSLVTRNAVEVVTDDELRALLKKGKKRVYAGYEPSGEIHLGHRVTVNKLIDLKEAGFEVVVLLADLHAFLNRKGTMEQVGELAEYNKRCFEGLGLRDVEYVLGSELQLSPDYQLMVLRLSQQITLNRAKRSMDEVGRNMDAPTVSQMIYPIMQMVDIARLNVDAAVGGIDQRKIHMLAREHLVNIGYPAPVCIHTPILNGVDGKKMSSSSGNYISVADTIEEIEKKCQKAFCPPECEEKAIGNTFSSVYYHTGVEWANDSQTIFYLTLDAAQRPDSLWRHTIGTDPSQDSLIFQEIDEAYFLFITKTRDDAYILTHHHSTRSIEMRFLSADRLEDGLRVLSPRRDGVEYHATHHEGNFYIVTNHEAINFRLVQAGVERSSIEYWQEVVPHREDVLLDYVDAF